jgi:hypothetical protein
MEGLMQNDGGATDQAVAKAKDKQRQPRLTAKEHYDLAETLVPALDGAIRVKTILAGRLPKNNRIAKLAGWMADHAGDLKDELNAEYVSAGHHDGRSPLPYDRPQERPANAAKPDHVVLGGEIVGTVKEFVDGAEGY